MLRHQIGRVAAAVVLLGVVGLLAVVTIGLLLAAIYHWVAPFWGAAGGFTVIASVSFLVMAMLGVWAYRWLR